MKDHEIAQTVNALAVIAREYAHTQQLRERIAQFVVPILKGEAHERGEGWPVGAVFRDVDSGEFLNERAEPLEHPEADPAHMVSGTVRRGLQRMPPPGIVEDELRRIVAQVAMPFSLASDNVLEQLRKLVHQCVLAERLSLSVCVRAAVAQLDAHAAADKPDVRLYDRDSYIAGYQDARTDADEAMRREFDK